MFRILSVLLNQWPGPVTCNLCFVPALPSSKVRAHTFDVLICSNILLICCNSFCTFAACPLWPTLHIRHLIKLRKSNVLLNYHPARRSTRYLCANDISGSSKRQSNACRLTITSWLTSLISLSVFTKFPYTHPLSFSMLISNNNSVPSCFLPRFQRNFWFTTLLTKISFVFFKEVRLIAFEWFSTTAKQQLGTEWSWVFPFSAR